MSLTRYIIGFVLSLTLTAGAFGLVELHLRSGHVFPPHEVAYPIIICFAIVQLFVQVIFFLHLGDEHRPRWKLLSFAFAGVVVAILIGGTLWIMHNVSHEHAEQPNTPYIGNVVTPQTSND